MMTIQSHSQSAWATASAIAQLLGLPPEEGPPIHTEGSGCYGHNMADDAAADAAMLARGGPGPPVRLQYTRAQEHKWEPYGSAMADKSQAATDDDGNVLDWTPDTGRRPTAPGRAVRPATCCPVASSRPLRAADAGTGRAAELRSARNAIADYVFPAHRLTDKFVPRDAAPRLLHPRARRLRQRLRHRVLHGRAGAGGRRRPAGVPPAAPQDPRARVADRRRRQFRLVGLAAAGRPGPRLRDGALQELRRHGPPSRWRSRSAAAMAGFA